jgi:hypothetical protein
MLSAGYYAVPALHIQFNNSRAIFLASVCVVFLTTFRISTYAGSEN